MMEDNNFNKEEKRINKEPTLDNNCKTLKSHVENIVRISSDTCLVENIMRKMVNNKSSTRRSRM